MNRLLDYTPYLLAGATIAFAAFSLIKDWGDYRHQWLKSSALVAMCLIAVLTFVSLRQGRASEKRMEGEVAAAYKTQKDNTALYVKSFGQLSQKVSDLQTEVTTEKLQKKLASVQAELQRTQKALERPKTYLSFSFDPPLYSSDRKRTIPSRTISLPVNANGVVHVPFDILNTTDIDAIDGDVTLVICDACKFAKEPAGFTKLSHQPATQRYLRFQRILAKTFVGESVDVSVPANDSNVEIGITFRCTTCILKTGISSGIIHLKRDYLKRF